MARAQAWHAAAAWVREHGGQVQGVAFDGARGGVQAESAEGDLSVGSCVLRIPMRLCITGREARASPMGRAAKDAATAVGASTLSRSTDDVVLAFHLAADVARGSLAFHAPYYATLPVNDDDPRCMLPRCWSDAELESLLGGSPSAAEAHRARAAVRADYATVSASARQLSDGALSDAWPSFDAFDWATAIVASRCFVLEEGGGAAGGGGSIEALVPLVDMLNHALDPVDMSRIPLELHLRAASCPVCSEASHALLRRQSICAWASLGSLSLSDVCVWQPVEPCQARRSNSRMPILSPPQARPRQTTYCVVDGMHGMEGALELRTLLRLHSGEPVHDTYGAKGNAQLLATYGFTSLPNLEPDGSSNDVRELCLPTTDADAALLVFVPPTVAQLRLGPKRYALHPLLLAVDAFRAAAAAAWERRAAPASTRPLRGAALEVRALRCLREALDAELGRYALSTEAAAAALEPCTPPGPPKSTLPRGALAAKRAAAAAALVLSEQVTLQFYRLIASLCLGVLAPRAVPVESGSEAMAGDDATADERRRTSAHRLRAEVEGEATGAPPSAVGEEVSIQHQTRQMAALWQCACRERAAPVALAFVQVRFPALLKSAATPSKKKKRV